MDGIEKITARIRADADAELAQLREQTEAQILEIQAQAKAQMDQERTAILARGRRAAEERLERLKSAAQLERRKLELAAKQEMLAKAYDEGHGAAEQAWPDGEYVGLLAGLAAEACVHGTGGGHSVPRRTGRAMASRWSPRPTRGWETAI